MKVTILAGAGARGDPRFSTVPAKLLLAAVVYAPASFIASCYTNEQGTTFNQEALMIKELRLNLVRSSYSY